MGRTFLVAQNDGTRVRAQVIEKINDLDAQNHQNIKLLCKLAYDKTQIIMDYQTICDLIEEQDQEELEGKHWTFKKILSHVGPIKPTDENYMGFQYNVRVLWEGNSITNEPLKIISQGRSYHGCYLCSREWPPFHTRMETSLPYCQESTKAQVHMLNHGHV